MAIPQSEFKVDTLYGLIGSAVQMIKRIATALELEDKKDGLAVFEYINKKDDRIYPIFQDYCRNIAYLIYNMQAVVDVERYVIGGGISAQAIVVSEIKHQYQQLATANDLLSFMHTPPEIQPCRFRNEANLLGALYQFLISVEAKQD